MPMANYCKLSRGVAQTSPWSIEVLGLSYWRRPI